MSNPKNIEQAYKILVDQVEEYIWDIGPCPDILDTKLTCRDFGNSVCLYCELVDTIAIIRQFRIDLDAN